jgi:TRAP-type C4-dicarboxylate transport system substrate-binding protein
MDFDFPVTHPRMAYLLNTASAYRQITKGGGEINFNPHGKRREHTELLAAMKSGETDVGWLNAAWLEQMCPELGASLLPFLVSDNAITRPGAREAYIAEINNHIADTGLEVVSLMRGADQIFAARDSAAISLTNIKGRSVRVASSGRYVRIFEALMALPEVIPISKHDVVDTDLIFTSPGAWKAIFETRYPFVTHVPGLMMINYVAVIYRQSRERDWWQYLRPILQEEVTDRWQSMMDQDFELLANIAQERVSKVSSRDMINWRHAVSVVNEEFDVAHPNARLNFKAALQML